MGHVVNNKMQYARIFCKAFFERGSDNDVEMIIIFWPTTRFFYVKLKKQHSHTHAEKGD